uniref:Uncharacterized protein n=1 Tax=viral metagenome TaxID=1070528 RepID=A0A6M3LPQ3_9ZZZZ
MKKLIFIFFLAGMVYAQNTDKAVATATTEKELIRKVVENTLEGVRVLLIDESGATASDTSAWTYEDTTLTLTTAATQLSVLLTRTKLIGDIVIQNAPASTVNIVGGWTSEASLVVFPSGSLHYDFLGNPKRFYLKSESGTPSVNISYKYKP